MANNSELDSILRQLTDATFLYNRFKDVINDVLHCMYMSRVTGEPHCMALEGCTGAGKSTVYKSASRKLNEGSETKIEPFYMVTPSPVTVKGMASEMLRIMGDPGYSKGTLVDMNSRLAKYIKELKVPLIVLDEIQHLISSETNRILSDVSDWLKTLIKVTGVPVLIIGIEGKVTRILDANPQLSRLFAARMRLEPFSWYSEDKELQKELQKEFNDLIVSFENVARKSLDSKVPRFELLTRIHYATNGVVGYLEDLFEYVIKMAYECNSQHLELSMFAEGFDKVLRVHLKKDNPFKVAPNKKFVPPDEFSL